MDDRHVQDETALLRRRALQVAWEPFRWTVGATWFPFTSTLRLYPCPCVGLDIHLPPRRTRAGAVRWFRSRLALFVASSVAIVIALAGFFVGRLSTPVPVVIVKPSASSLASAVVVDVDPVLVVPAPTLSVSSSAPQVVDATLEERARWSVRSRPAPSVSVLKVLPPHQGRDGF